MASIFLSYDHSDELLVGQIRGLLSKAGIRCWYDRVDLQPGASFIGGIEAAIKEFDYLGVVLSRASVNSPWVKAEVDLGADLRARVWSGSAHWRSSRRL